MIDKLLELKYLYILKSFGIEYVDKFNNIKVEVDNWKSLQKDVFSCHLCPLSKTRTNIVFGEGNTNADILFVGEGPGEMEDKTGRPFVGRSGELLTKMIENVLDIKREDVYIANIVKCRPPNNRAPTIEEAHTCMPYLLKQIKLINPKIIVALGKTAYQYLTNDFHTPISKARGKVYDIMGHKLVATFHPSYLLRNPSQKYLAFEDLKFIKRLKDDI